MLLSLVFSTQCTISFVMNVKICSSNSWRIILRAYELGTFLSVFESNYHSSNLNLWIYCKPTLLCSIELRWMRDSYPAVLLVPPALIFVYLVPMDIVGVVSSGNVYCELTTFWLRNRPTIGIICSFESAMKLQTTSSTREASIFWKSFYLQLLDTFAERYFLF